MVWKRKTTRKTYRKKRAYKKRIYKKRSAKTYNKKQKPWRCREEDQVQRVVHTAARDIVSKNAAGTDNVQHIIYWACATTSPGYASSSSADGYFSTTFESVLSVELNPYLAMYKQHKLNWVRIRYTPTTLDYSSSVTTALNTQAYGYAIGVHRMQCLDLPQGTRNPYDMDSIDTEMQTSPLAITLNPRRKYTKYIRVSDYLKQFNQDFYTGATTSWTNFLGATVLQFNYVNLAASTQIGRLEVDYCVSYKGRQIPV